MAGVIRDRNPEQSLANTQAALKAAQATLDSRGTRNTRAIGGQFPRDLMAGDPASPGGTKVTVEELEGDLSALVGSLGPPVQTLQDLRDVPPNARVDQQRRLVEDDEAVWRFDTADTTTPDDGDTVVVPTDTSSNNGRWFRVDLTLAEFNAHVIDPNAHHTPPTVPASGTILHVDDAASLGTSTATGASGTVFTSNIKLSFTPAGGPFTGKFKLHCRAEFSHDTPGGDTEVRLHRTDIGPIELAFNEEESADSDDWNTFDAGDVVLVLTAESPTFEIQFRTAQVAETALIRQARMSFEQVVP